MSSFVSFPLGTYARSAGIIPMTTLTAMARIAGEALHEGDAARLAFLGRELLNRGVGPNHLPLAFQQLAVGYSLNFSNPPIDFDRAERTLALVEGAIPAILAGIDPVSLPPALRLHVWTARALFGAPVIRPDEPILHGLEVAGVLLLA